MGGGDCAVCGHPAREEIEARIRAGEPLKQILDDYNSPTVYHEPKYIGDRGWYEHQSLPLAYHEFVCMGGEKWPKLDAKKIMVKPIAADLPQESLENRKVWYVPPKPGEDCAKPYTYPEGTPGGYWREYPPESDIPDAKPQTWEGVNREPNDPGKAWKKGGICQPPSTKPNLDESNHRRDPPCLRSPAPEPQGEGGRRYKIYANHDLDHGKVSVKMNSGKYLTFQPTGLRWAGRTVKEDFPSEDYPNRDGVPIRGKYFIDPKEKPQAAAISRPLPDEYKEILNRIEEWEIKHNPKPEPFKLDDLQSRDYYTKFYINDLQGAAKYNDIKLEQIKLAPLDADLWEKYRLIEGTYHIIQIEALKDGRLPTVFRSSSKFPFYHDSLIQLRNLIHKRTGLNYKTVERGLNHMLKKSIIKNLRETRAYILDIRCDWNRTNIWHMECERKIDSRKKHGPDWIKKDFSEWQDCGDFKWPHHRRYCKEHETII